MRAPQNPNDSNQSGIVLTEHNPTVIQALYHAVTGKTEKLSRPLLGNVVISLADMENLHTKINQQIHHYDLVATPTVTLVVREARGRSTRYSSWERFRGLQQSSSEVTSDVSYQMEFLIRLPKTDPQRYKINILLDSGLEMLMEHQQDDFQELFDVYFFSRNYRAVSVSIDFVDFLVAKAFLSAAEDWFEGLERIQTPKWVEIIRRNVGVMNSVMGQFGRVGAALFVAGFAFLDGNKGDDIREVLFGTAIMLALWSVVAVVTDSSRRSFSLRLFKSLIPSAVIITAGDQRAFDKIRAHAKGLINELVRVLVTATASVLLNLVSSLIYDSLR